MKLYNFKPEEFTMDGLNVFDDMNEKFLLKLDNVREVFGQPMIITSSYRNERYNKKIGGADSSMHLLGRAVDVRIDKYSGKQIRKLIHILSCMDLTYGIDKQFIHIDDRESSTMWIY